MNYTAQIIYPQFVEEFQVELNGGHIDIHLKKVLEESLKKHDVLTLDLSGEIRKSYSIFPFRSGDMMIMQAGMTFVVSFHNESRETEWLRFDFNDLFQFISKQSSLPRLLDMLQDDRQILINSLLSDLLRTDFSRSGLNKKVKYLKLSILLEFIKYRTGKEYKRVIIDETILGDVNFEDIGMALQYAGSLIIGGIKIGNVLKIITLLKQNNIIQAPIDFIEDVFFFAPQGFHPTKVSFSNPTMDFQYNIEAYKNYVFEMGDKYVDMHTSTFTVKIRGKLFVFNGDDRNLMIGSSKDAK